MSAAHPERQPPSTRYQGSKLKLVRWIWEHIRDLPFASALDVFGGTGCVSYLLKSKHKAVTYNDYLQFNHCIGAALIENSSTRLSNAEAAWCIARHDFAYDDFIQRTFRDIYFTDEENAWLDVVAQNIPRMSNRHKQAMAYYALFQSCIAKRPYNLFHRKNLYMRTAEVERSFGNKATWDTPFADHFRQFVAEARKAVFDSGVECKALCRDALDVPGAFDLVYIDPPYVGRKGVGVDYLDFYHFLEGLVDYGRWMDRIDWRRKHRPLRGKRSPWSDARRTREAFQALFRRYRDAILVVSYRSDGIPSAQELVDYLRAVKDHVTSIHYGEYKYALSTNGDSKEILLVGR